MSDGILHQARDNDALARRKAAPPVGHGYAGDRFLHVGRRLFAGSPVVTLPQSLVIDGDVICHGADQVLPLERTIEEAVADAGRLLRHQSPHGQDVECAAKKGEAVGVDMLVDRFDRGQHQGPSVGANRPAQCGDVVALGDRCSGGHARFDVIELEPIVSVEKADRFVLVRRSKERANAAGRAAVVAMRRVKREVASSSGKPILRVAVGNHEVVGAKGLALHAGNASLEDFGGLAKIRGHNGVGKTLHGPRSNRAVGGA